MKLTKPPIPLLCCLAVACGDDDGGSPETETPSSDSSASGGMDTTPDPTDTTNPTQDGDTSDPTGDPTGGDPTGSDPTGDETDDTGPMGCLDDAECTNADNPFCITGTCVNCTALDDGDAGCAQLDASTPLCVASTCVECSSTNDDACGGTQPICNQANSCEACDFHADCLAGDNGACNLADGSCLDTVVNDPSNLATAIGELNEGDRVTYVLPSGSSVSTDLVLPAGVTVAIVGAATAYNDFPIINGTPGVGDGNLQVPATSTLFLHRVRVQGDNLGISIDGGTLYIDEAAVVRNGGGGISATNGATVNLRNAFVGGPETSPALAATSSSINILYSTLGRALHIGSAPVVECTTPVSTTIRNSLIINASDVAGVEVSCEGDTIEGSAIETSLTPGVWFGGNFGQGEFQLTGEDASEFATTASWQTGDSPTDIDGQARPTADGTADYAGADIPDEG